MQSDLTYILNQYLINSKMNQHDKWFLTEKRGSKYNELCFIWLEFLDQFSVNTVVIKEFAFLWVHQGVNKLMLFKERISRENSCLSNLYQTEAAKIA